MVDVSIAFFQLLFFLPHSSGKDVEAGVLFAGVPTRLLVTQTAPGGVNINSVHVLDRTYVLQLYTLAGGCGQIIVWVWL